MNSCFQQASIAVTSAVSRTLWLQAGAGITTSGVAPNILVTTWADQSGNNHNFTQNTDANKFTFQPAGSPFVFPTVSMTAQGTNNSVLMTSDDGLKIKPPYTLLMCFTGLQTVGTEQYIGVLGDFNASVVNTGAVKEWNHYQPWHTGNNPSGNDDLKGAGLLTFIIAGFVVNPTGFCRSFFANITAGSALTVISDFGLAADTDSGISLLGSNSFTTPNAATPSAYSGSIAELIILPSDYAYDGVNWDPTTGLTAEVTRLQNTYG